MDSVPTTTADRETVDLSLTFFRVSYVFSPSLSSTFCPASVSLFTPTVRDPLSHLLHHGFEAIICQVFRLSPPTGQKKEVFRSKLPAIFPLSIYSFITTLFASTFSVVSVINVKQLIWYRVKLADHLYVFSHLLRGPNSFSLFVIFKKTLVSISCYFSILDLYWSYLYLCTK